MCDLNVLFGGDIVRRIKMLVIVWGKGVSIFFHTSKGCPLDNMKTKKGKSFVNSKRNYNDYSGTRKSQERERERERVMLVTELHFLKSVSIFPSVLLSMKVAKSFPPHKLQKNSRITYMYAYKKNFKSLF